MPDWNKFLDFFTLFGAALGGYLLSLLKTSGETVTKALLQELNRSAELNRELQKARGLERQGLRFQSYGKLWKELRPLAIYDDTLITKEAVRSLYVALSDWYFSEDGGLLLTQQARNFYFTLQNLLRVTSRMPEEWYADRSEESEGAQRERFQALLVQRGIPEAAAVLQYFKAGKFDGWQAEAMEQGRLWRDGIARIAAFWLELDDIERFITLQQVGSILRSSLVIDLDSRLR